MKTKIARNDEKIAKIMEKEDILDSSINTLVINKKKFYKLKLRVKENKSRQRPKAPHNTTQYLSTIYENNRNNEENIILSHFNYNQIDEEKSYTIENFLIAGGSLKGEFFKNVYDELNLLKENKNVLVNSFLRNLA